MQVFSVQEDDDTPGREVGIVDVAEEEEGGGGGTFELLDGDPGGTLAVHSRTGAVTAVRPMDREEKAAYDLMV